jgi:phenylacetic acid degradation operon negative regulatory protein
LVFVVNNAGISDTISDTASATLLEPLNPRSIVLSVLLGSHPPQMPVHRILEFTSLFDLADGTVRTALSRMVAAGDLVNDEGTYRLAARLVERQAQQDAGRHDPPADWDGSWWTVAIVSDRRSMAERRDFRARAIGARLGELRPDLWLRPANIAIATDLPDAVVIRGPMFAGDERQLAEQLWDLDVLRIRAAAHRGALDDAAVRLVAGDDRSLADSFVTLAAAQQFLRVEPQLPDELSPDGGARAVRARYADVVAAFQGRLAEFFAQSSSAGPERRADQYNRAVS